MRLFYITPRLKAIGKLFILRQIINDEFNNTNPYSRTPADWINYQNICQKIDKKLEKLGVLL